MQITCKMVTIVSMRGLCQLGPRFDDLLTHKPSEAWTWGTRPEKKDGLAPGRRDSSREEAQWSHTPSDTRNSDQGTIPGVCEAQPL